MAFEIKDYSHKIKLGNYEFVIDIGNIIYLEKISELQKGFEDKCAEFEKAEDKLKAAAEIIQEKIKSIGIILGDKDACNKILGEKANSAQNISDLFDYLLTEIIVEESKKFTNKLKEYAPKGEKR